MPVSAALRRLLHVRNLEEEQQRLALESALADLHELDRALDQARARERRGRERIPRSAADPSLRIDPADRIAALVETRSAARHAACLVPRIAAAELAAANLRRLYLEKRVERRQAETLIHESQALDALQSARRAQQGIDDWFGARRHRNPSSPNPPSARTAPRPPAEKP